MITLAAGSVLEVSLKDARVGDVVPVLGAPVVAGRFSRITVLGGGFQVAAWYRPSGMFVRVISAD